MGLIGGAILVGIGAVVSWIVKGKVDDKEKKDPYKPEKEDY